MPQSEREKFKLGHYPRMRYRLSVATLNAYYPFHKLNSER
jgi:hypothetical protein